MAAPYDGKKILIVDDDPDILTAITAALSDSGAELLKASDGNQAVTIAEERDVDLLILDAMMPKKSGFLVLERLKSKKPLSAKPQIIMITANTGKRHQAWAESLGAMRYINKPFAMETLIEATEEVLALMDNPDE